MLNNLEGCAKDCLEGMGTKIENQTNLNYLNKLKRRQKCEDEEKEEKIKENVISHSFLADPFLALQNDLDDVSEVIKHNLISEEFIIVNSVNNNNIQQNSPINQNIIERSKSLDREDNFIESDNLNSDSNKERKIHQIVNLLQQPEKRQHPQLTRQTVSFDDHLGFLSPFSTDLHIRNNSYDEHLIGFDQFDDPMIGGNNYGEEECGNNNGSLCPPLMTTTENHSLHFLQQNSTVIENVNSEAEKQKGFIREHEEITIMDNPEHKNLQEKTFWQLTNQQQLCRQISVNSNINIVNESPPPIEPISAKNKNSLLNIEERTVKQELSTANIDEIQNYNNTQNTSQEEAAMLAKQEFLQLLLQITPEELEHLRSRKALQAQSVQPQSHLQQFDYNIPLQCSQPIFIQTGQPQHQFNTINQNPIYSQQQQSPPLDPLHPPLPYNMDYGIAQSINTINNPLGQYGVQQITQQPPQMAQPSYFYSSPSSGCSTGTLLSPLSNGGGYPSVATSDFLEESDSQIDQDYWGEGEMVEGTEINPNCQVNEQMMGSEEGNSAHERAPQGRRKTHKTERRTAHNLIEKKYRCSINDRINQLKGMLATEDNTKLSKSATLRRAVENIHTLRAKNAELAGENGRLRRALEMAGLRAADTSTGKMGINTTSMIVGQHTEQPEILLKGPTMQRSRVSSSIKKCNNNASISSTNVSSVVGPRDQSRVTLCVFMFLLLIYNPLAFLFTETSSNSSNIGGDLSQQENIAIFGAHRTLTGDDLFGQSVQDNANKIPFSTMSQSHVSVNSVEHWPNSSLLRHSLIWLLNCLFVFAILNRLLVSGEPVADCRSPRWGAFLQSRRKAAQAVAAGNWKEAQRCLGESLQILERPLPYSGGLDEWMSLIWQIIRHLLNVLWIGRWFARRRRTSLQTQKSVCRSHAATSMVYNQLHQLHLLGVDGIGLTQRGALNIALLAANLAESAGSSAISHAFRAEMYACAAIRCRLCLPRWLRLPIAGYFFRRAKRHVSKSHRLEGNKEQLYSLQWAFHPLARKFLADPNRLAAILDGSGAQRQTNFPFTDSTQSAKPLEVLRDAFKIHLLDALLSQLDSAEGLRVPDFVERSQLLLQISIGNRTHDTAIAMKCKDNCGESSRKDSEALTDILLSSNTSAGDELCTWWAHLLSSALHWRHGDMARARQHNAIVRKCPQDLLQSDTALAVGLAFCSRKICLEDRKQKAWTEMALLHAEKAFAHLQRENRFHKWQVPVECQGNGIDKIQCRFRLLCCQWILSTLLDLCSFSIGPEQTASIQIRQLYSDVMLFIEKNGFEQMEPRRLTMFKHLGETLCCSVEAKAV